MERTRVAKVDDVTLARRGEQVVGNLHLTPHHIIFSHLPPTPNNVQTQDTPTRPKELWITYPIISFCTYRPTPAASRQPSSIRLRCRDFAFVCFYFASESKARDVYECIKGWTCKVGRIDKLYAFTYQPPPPERELNGWELYNPRKEWARQGVDQEGHGWRISQINMDYGFSPTYPAIFPIPSAISDNTLNYAGRYRSRARVPVLTYLHPINNCSITRSSQPLVGVRQNRSIQDEKLLAAIFSTSRSERPLAGITPAQLESESSSSTQGDMSSNQAGITLTNAEELEEEMLAFQGDTEQKPHVYGAQQHNLIVDARPTVNAFAMQAVGLGSENMDNYKFATKAYLGIDNIHVMRDSLNKVIDALKESDVTPLGPNKDLLARSGWLKHISGILDGAGLIARQVGLQHSHVLIHCSDGWDRTSQLSALSQVCLDPYYRTMEGFMVLVEKDWLSFGHMFRHRSGHLNSDKWFQIENERIGGDSNRGFGDSGGAGKAIENAFLSAKGFFNRDNTSRDSLPDSEGEMQSYDSDKPGLKNPSPAPRSAGPEKEVTKVKETSPVFHQFLDATYQLLHQYPTRFEFNERFLRRLLYHLYACQFGTFLFNSEKERVDWKAKERTRSVWDYFLARREQFLNPQYDSIIDDHKRGKERLIFPRLNEVKWWSEAFGRTDAEMNGVRSASATAPISRDTSRARTPVLTAVESSHSPVGNAANDRESPKAVAAEMDDVSLGVSDLSFSKNKENGQASKAISQMEVEMQ
ncbi:phosphatidylinositol-3-phosphatase YMR1 [Aspergillus melleus]|uniref:phosphatidylinositol-3-phosphatase YMR1 n=1 Tax=Aspergillus melleus TaxID=138277 RepID=UPI001E8E95D8|nr:phosphatidylinositol-3-phosphatase ymr1 [Aspergillus melleus]KAH8422715.1 phosphatidylinositol-3-phosphatase ymr1 [Aspergillus melleus]